MALLLLETVAEKTKLHENFAARNRTTGLYVKELYDKLPTSDREELARADVELFARRRDVVEKTRGDVSVEFQLSSASEDGGSKASLT